VDAKLQGTSRSVEHHKQLWRFFFRYYYYVAEVAKPDNVTVNITLIFRRFHLVQVIAIMRYGSKW
jgi:hypothetical protein